MWRCKLIVQARRRCMTLDVRFDTPGHSFARNKRTWYTRIVYGLLAVLFAEATMVGPVAAMPTCFNEAAKSMRARAVSSMPRRPPAVPCSSSEAT